MLKWLSATRQILQKLKNKLFSRLVYLNGPFIEKKQILGLFLRSLYHNTFGRRDKKKTYMFWGIYSIGEFHWEMSHKAKLSWICV